MLSRPLTPEDKTPYRLHLEQIAKQTGRVPPLLSRHAATSPFLADIWRAFVDLKRNGGVVTYTMYLARAQATGLTLPTWKQDVLFALENLFNNVVNRSGEQ